jgi:hypothetical protein
MYFNFVAATLLLFVLMLTPRPAEALSIEYDYATGGVTVVDITPNLDELSVYWPARYSTMESFYDDVLDPGAREFLSRYHSNARRPGSYMLNWLFFESRFGFEDSLYLGEIMLPEVDYQFEKDVVPHGVEPWNQVGYRGTYAWERFPFVRVMSVPEPSSSLLLVLGVCVIWTVSKIARMK